MVMVMGDGPMLLMSIRMVHVEVYLNNKNHPAVWGRVSNNHNVILVLQEFIHD
jgi:hypothetical protein